jgi:hypothetical protein
MKAARIQQKFQIDSSQIKSSNKNKIRVYTFDKRAKRSEILPIKKGLNQIFEIN